MVNSKNDYYSFSPRLNMFLMFKGIHYTVADTHKVTGKNFWRYERTEELDKALEEYTRLKSAIGTK